MNPPGASAGTGRVVAVCAAAKRRDGLSKDPLPRARISRWGIPGDHHYGETLTHPRTGVVEPNDRPITVVAVEGVRHACTAVGIAPLPAGALGENLLVEGLGDLSSLAAGDVLEVGDAGAVLEVTMQNPPCKNMTKHHEDLMRALVSRRGVICIVRSEGNVSPGDPIRLRSHGGSLGR